jgi:putative oxidoreductase
MTTKSRAIGWLLLALRIALGGVFIYAGAIKLNDPLQFADNIALFSILPVSLINPLALSLPIFEILSGGLLVVGWLRRPAALAVVVISVVFLGAIASALARGLTIDCGCFGGGVPSRERMWLDLGRDLVLLAAALLTYLHYGSRLTETRKCSVLESSDE